MYKLHGGHMPMCPVVKVDSQRWGKCTSALDPQQVAVGFPSIQCDPKHQSLNLHFLIEVQI